MRLRWLAAALLAVAFLILWLRAADSVRRTNGHFSLYGMDFGHYWAQAMALRQGSPADLYNLEALEQQRRKLIRAYTLRKPNRVRPGHVVYPPVFAYLFAPFTRARPHVAFRWWVGLNFLAAGWIAWRAASAFPPARRPLVVAVVLASHPVAFSLYIGQAHLWVALALGECFLALKRGRDVAAGLWLGVLSLKPQYALLLGPALLLLRRWRTALAALLVVAGVVGASLALAGPGALRGYPEAARYMGRSDPADQDLMISWRSVVLFLAGVDAAPSLRHLALAALIFTTSIVAVLVWRSGWRVESEGFAARFAFTLSATVMIDMAVFPYGPAVLAVPLAHAWPSMRRRETRLLVLLFALVPALFFTLAAPGSRDNSYVALFGSADVMRFLHLALFVALAVEALRDRP